MFAAKSGCVAILLAGLTAPALAQDRTTIASVTPTISVPKIAVDPALASRAIVPATASVLSLQATAAATANLVAPSVVAPPRLDLMPRTLVPSQPGAISTLDITATHEATKALTSKGEAAVTNRAATRGEVTAAVDTGVRIDTNTAASSTGVVTDAGSVEPAQSPARPMVLPTCR
jgi:hypothetical protein